MNTEEEKKKLLDEIEKSRHQQWLEMMADYQTRIKFAIDVTDRFLE